MSPEWQRERLTRRVRVLRKFQGNLSEIKKKGDIDLVTEADTASEKLIIDTIQADFPDPWYFG